MINRLEKSQLAIIGADILWQSRFIPGKILLIQDGKISDLIESEDAIPKAAHRIDAQGQLAIPGLIDLHLHMDQIGVEQTQSLSMEKVAHHHGSFGTTRFLGAFCADRLDRLKEKLQIFHQWSHESKGAKPVGVHFESPFLNPKKAGAQPQHHFLSVTENNINEFVSLLDGQKGQMGIVTLAPELEGISQLIQRIQKKDWIVGMGHTDATYERIMQCVDEGVYYATHFFNQSRLFHHRDPGLIGAVLESDQFFIELIADGFHLHPAIHRLMWKIKGKDRILLVSDSVWPVSSQGPPRTDSGDLAGSSATLLDCVVKFKEDTGCTLEEALSLASYNPAKMLGLEDRLGSIDRGHHADVVLIDRDHHVMMTLIDGEVIYNQKRS